jgi:hypothetical protein
MERTFNHYEDVGCLFANGPNDYIRYLKYGFSKVSDHAARDIRLKRLTIETARDYILDYTFKKPSEVEILCDWLGISVSKYLAIIEKFRNKDHFNLPNSDQSNYIRAIQNLNLDDFSENKLIQMDKDVIYQKTKNREIIDEKQLIMIGRVYSDKYNYGAIQDMPEGYGKLI